MARDIATRATWLVSRASLRSHTLLQEAFAAAGARPYHYRLLETLAKSGPISQADLGRATAIDRSDVTAALETLDAAGFTTRSPDPTDRRRKLVEITPAGHTELTRLDTIVDEVQTRFLAPLTPTERATYLSLTARLT